MYYDSCKEYVPKYKDIFDYIMYYLFLTNTQLV